MTRTLLIATVAALAITAPTQAQDRGERGKRGDQVQKSKSDRGGQRAERRERAPRVERRAERQERASRVERRAERQERAPRAERRAERQERASRVERRAERQERASRAERRVERQERAPRVERRAQRTERAQRVERRERAIEQRPARQNRIEQSLANREERIDNRASRQERRAERRQDQRQNMWASLAQRRAARIDDDRRERRVERRIDDRSDRRAERRIARVGQRFDGDRYDDYVPFVYRARYQDTPRYFYRYDDDDGYLYQVRRDNNLVSALVPLLGGAYSVGRPLPLSYSSYNVPYGYRSLYYDTPDHYYRYGSGAIYRVDSQTNLIQAIVALLAGQSFGVGQMLPASYGTYNVPYGYRDRYFDTADSWYRYNDGNIYQIDPRTRLIEEMYPINYGFAIGSPMPYGYADYNVPYGYRDLYYDTPDYNYRYANGGIYQVDPTTQVVQALVALVTGQNFNVGQVMPTQYGVYNVPYAYRDRYYDTADNWYRYNDGMIYELDPRTRVIRDTHYIYA